MLALGFTIFLSSCTKEALAEDDIIIETQVTEGDDAEIVPPPPPPSVP